MKKIVGIIAALSLVAGVAFADEPAYPAGAVAAFSGEASIEYQIDLDNEAFGIVNAEKANFKIQFYNGGDKATTGDGLWGELKVSVGAGDAETKNSDGGDKNGAFQMKKPSVDTAKIHFVDDDFYASMNIKAQVLKLVVVIFLLLHGLLRLSQKQASVSLIMMMLQVQLRLKNTMKRW
jgi:hypothetical protein